MASSQRGLKIQMNSGLAELRHVIVRLSAPMRMLSTPQIRFGGGGEGEAAEVVRGCCKLYSQNVILF